MRYLPGIPKSENIWKTIRKRSNSATDEKLFIFECNLNWKCFFSSPSRLRSSHGQKTINSNIENEFFDVSQPSPIRPQTKNYSFFEWNFNWKSIFFWSPSRLRSSRLRRWNENESKTAPKRSIRIQIAPITPNLYFRPPAGGGVCYLLRITAKIQSKKSRNMKAKIRTVQDSANTLSFRRFLTFCLSTSTFPWKLA